MAVLVIVLRAGHLIRFCFVPQIGLLGGARKRSLWLPPVKTTAESQVRDYRDQQSCSKERRTPPLDISRKNGGVLVRASKIQVMETTKLIPPRNASERSYRALLREAGQAQT